MNNLSQRIIKFKNYFLIKYWPDPVWSKVISAGIIFIISGVLLTIWTWIKSIYFRVPFKIIANEVFTYFTSSSQINNIVLWISCLTLMWTLFLFFQKFIRDISLKYTNDELNEVIEEIPIIREHSTVLFSYRLSKAFPGQRGLKWYDSKVAVERFKILFQKPLIFKSSGEHGCMPDPIWWFRAGSCSYINKYKALSKTKVLLGRDELELKRIAVYISESYYECFVYVEAVGERQTGLYNTKPEHIKKQIDMFGFSSEEYGILGKIPIKHEDFDDGATIINNKVIDASKAELRRRFLSNYNFIISAKQAPYNSKRFDRESKRYFDGILRGENTTESFFEFLKTLEKREI